MSSMKRTAKKVAKHGRFGDTQILHVGKSEIKGIEALIGRPLPRNPITGQKEAFFFLPFLASLFGAAAPAAIGTAASLAAPIAAGAAGAAGLGALGSGMAAGIGAAGAGAAGAGAAGAGTLASLAATAPAAAGISALPAITSAIPSAAPALASAAAPAAATAPLSAALTVPAGAASTTTSAITPALSGAAAAAPAATVPLDTGIATAAGVSPTTGAAVGSAASDAGPAGGGIMGWLKANPMMAMGGLGMLAQMAQGLGKSKGKGKKDNSNEAKDIQYEGGDPVFPDSGYKGGISSEFNYFPKRPVTQFAEGGVVPKPYAKPLEVGTGRLGSDTVSPTGMIQMRGMNSRGDPSGYHWQMAPESAIPRPKDTGIAALPTTTTPPPLSGYSSDYRPGIDPERPMVDPNILAPSTDTTVPGTAPAGNNPLYPVRGFAAGGIVDLPQQGMQGMPATPVPAVPGAAAQPSLPQPVGVGDIPKSPYPKKQIGASSENDKELVAKTVEAIKGNIPDPNPVLMEFVKQFGEPALYDLANRVKAVNGAQASAQAPSPTDTVPAMLTPGEFVMKKGAVDKIGAHKLEALNNIA